MSTVIKAGHGGAVLKRLSTVDLADHLAEADAVVAAARRRAETILAEANRSAEEKRQVAHRGGYEAGHAEGVAAGTAEGRRAAFEEALRRFASQHGDVAADMGRAIEEIGRMKGDLRIAAERDLLEFAVRLASRLTLEIGRTNRDAVAANLARALRCVEAKSDLLVRVNPADLESLRTFAPTLLAAASTTTAVAVEPDESIAPGGCVVRAGRTQVDASLETQIGELVALLLGGTKTDG
jgi:flagellar assembly protein FliH